MTCQDIRGQLTAFLLGELEVEREQPVAAHLGVCDPCADELEGLAMTWENLGQLPQEEPSPAMRRRFLAMLAGYDRGRHEPETHRNPPARAGWMPRWTPLLQIAAAAALFALGLWLGRGATTPPASRTMPGLAASGTAEPLRLLTGYSANDRLRGVLQAARMEGQGEQTVAILLGVIDNDPSVNVRLAAIEALGSFMNLPRARDGLAQSLRVQDSPLVQLALIDALVRSHHEDTPYLLETLLTRPGLNPEVQSAASENLTQWQ